mmetsp:Transcript_14508/g.27509  ORF Transcript_14508/g.27509 Transcript_14508/m.27509 type:complete len:88 (-) Transcript_14508:27-290(-)
MAYLIRYRGMTLAEAFESVRSKRRLAFPNIGFLSQLELWERAIHDGKSTLKKLPVWKKKVERCYPPGPIEEAAKRINSGSANKCLVL